MDLTKLAQKNNIKMTAELFNGISELALMTGAIDDKTSPQEAMGKINAMFGMLNNGGYGKDEGGSQLIELGSQAEVDQMVKDIKAQDPEAVTAFLNLAPRSKELVKMGVMKETEAPEAPKPKDPRMGFKVPEDSALRKGAKGVLNFFEGMDKKLGY
jgi:hypothetical protein